MTEQGLDLDPIIADPALALGFATEDAARLLARLEGVEAVLRARLLADGQRPSQVAETPPEDRLLTPREAAARLGLTLKQVYNRAKSWPFTVRVGRKTLRFSSLGLERSLMDGGVPAGPPPGPLAAPGWNPKAQPWAQSEGAQTYGRGNALRNNGRRSGAKWMANPRSG